jgi:hypothetical protein
MFATEEMNVVPVIDALICIVSHESRAVDGCLICSVSRTFAEHSSGFLFGIVVIASRGNLDFYFDNWRVCYKVATLLSWCTVHCCMHWLP